MVAHALHVNLTPALARPPAPCAVPVLAPDGPRACLGGARDEHNLAIAVRPDERSLFGPRGACLLGARGPLWVSDTGHHRLLGWAQAPAADGAPADWVIGQPDFFREGRNARGPAHATTLNVPTGIVACGKGLAVADAWNHRVLIWHSVPRAHNAAPDLVLGQDSFCAVEPKRGHSQPGPHTLFWPYGVAWDGQRLWVADTGNRRVLMWQGLPERPGQPADLVLGQAGFAARDADGGSEPNARSMRWPHAVALWGGRLCVADAGDNRILIWDGVPSAHNAASRWVLGQHDFQAVDHNQSRYWPSDASLQMPYGLAVTGRWCLVADTANSRLLAWSIETCEDGAAATALSGQAQFNAKGDNGWRLPTRESLSWPYAIGTCDQLAVIADSGNNRVLLWPLAAQLLA